MVLDGAPRRGGSRRRSPGASLSHCQRCCLPCVTCMAADTRWPFGGRDPYRRRQDGGLVLTPMPDLLPTRGLCRLRLHPAGRNRLNSRQFPSRPDISCRRRRGTENCIPSDPAPPRGRGESLRWQNSVRGSIFSNSARLHRRPRSFTVWRCPAALLVTPV